MTRILLVPNHSLFVFGGSIEQNSYSLFLENFLELMNNQRQDVFWYILLPKLRLNEKKLYNNIKKKIDSMGAINLAAIQIQRTWRGVAVRSLYRNMETKSGIKKAIKETERRRQIQIDYNKKNKIDAKSVKKEISDILESVYEKDYVKISEGSNIGGNLKKHLKALDKKMKDAASNLEFEEAAKIRDEIRKLESTELEITLNPKIRQYDVKNKLYPKGRSTMGMPGTRPRKAIKKWKPKK